MRPEQQLPASHEAEQGLVGALLRDNGAWDRIGDMIRAEDFFFTREGLLFRTIQELSEQGTPFDVITMEELLTKRGLIEEAGGLAYIAELAKNTPSSANVRAYANIVRERSQRRQLVKVGHQIQVDARTAEDVKDALDKAQSLTMGIGEKSLDKGPQSARELMGQVVDYIDTRFHQGDQMSGISTGYADIDKRLDGLQPADLIIIAGRPSMGKTTYAMNLAENIALAGHGVLVFSMEMPGKQLMLRSAASIGRVPFDHLKRGAMNDDDWPKLTAAAGKLAQANLHIIDLPALSPMSVRTISRRHMRTHGLEAVIIDYLQLMRGTGNNRNEEIGSISRSLKAMAKELNIPVIVLSQLNRGVEQRPNKRPRLSDLRESGEIEQDADIIQMLYRDEVYNEDSPDKGTVEVITAKFRNGEIGTDRLYSNLTMCRFDNFIQHDRWSAS